MTRSRARIWWCAGVASVLAGCAAARPSVEPLAGNLYRAIWSDVAASMLIFNGDPLAADWYKAGSNAPGTLDHHIRNLRCRGGAKPYRCTFSLLRDEAGPPTPGAAPARLACWALFDRAPPGGQWVVKHYPSDGWVHTQSTMSCHRLGGG